MNDTIMLGSLLLLFVTACGGSSAESAPRASDDPSPPSTPLPSTEKAAENEAVAESDAKSVDGGVARCSMARAQALGASDSVSEGAVTLLGTTSGGSRIYADATAGGPAAASASPWLFISLATGSRVDISDAGSTSSTAWDVAIRRASLYTNGGDGGPGLGGALFVQKAFADVTAADATNVTIPAESFYDPSCNVETDASGAVRTTFSSWYTYDPMSHTLAPSAGTWLVRGANGALYKLRIETYYGAPDGGTSMAGGAYVFDAERL